MGPRQNHNRALYRDSTLLRPHLKPRPPITDSGGASSSNELSDDELSSDRSSSSKLSDDVSANSGSSDFDSSDEESSVEYKEGNASDHKVLLVNYHELNKESKIKPDSPRVEEKEDTDPLRRRNIEKTLPEPRNCM